MDAAIEIFYTKVLADARIKHFLEDINMNAQRRRKEGLPLGSLRFAGEVGRT